MCSKIESKLALKATTHHLTLEKVILRAYLITKIKHYPSIIHSEPIHYYLVLQHFNKKAK